MYEDSTTTPMHLWGRMIFTSSVCSTEWTTHKCGAEVSSGASQSTLVISCLEKYQEHTPDSLIAAKHSGSCCTSLTGGGSGLTVVFNTTLYLCAYCCFWWPEAEWWSRSQAEEHQKPQVVWLFIWGSQQWEDKTIRKAIREHQILNNSFIALIILFYGDGDDYYCCYLLSISLREPPKGSNKVIYLSIHPSIHFTSTSTKWLYRPLCR